MSKNYVVIKGRDILAVFSTKEDAVVYVNRNIPKMGNDLDDVIKEMKVDPSYGLYKKFKNTFWIYKESMLGGFELSEENARALREGNRQSVEIEDVESPMSVTLELDIFDRRCMSVVIKSCTESIPTDEEMIEAVREKIDLFNKNNKRK